MDAWPSPSIPRLPGQGVPLRVFDSASGRASAGRQPEVAPVRLRHHAHMTRHTSGHAATYVAFDLMQRVWLDNGIDVNYVQNVTDIDDPLLERANATGQDWAELARAETHLFREDMAALESCPRASTSARWRRSPRSSNSSNSSRQRRGVRARRETSTSPFPVTRRFGHISHLSRDEMVAVFAERGGDPQRVGKKDPLDSLLWQAERAGEPAWDSAIGRGRPGWHIECAAIALQHLGDGFDVQGGGSDLAFPHHEMCAAQAQIATGKNPFARTYVHAGMVGLRRAQDVEVEGQSRLCLKASRRWPRPDGDPPRAARPPLPRRLGVGGGRPAPRRGST